MDRRLRTAVQWAAAAALYYGAAWLGLRMAVYPETASPIWPAAGVAIAALTLLDLRAWPAIAVAVYLVELPAFGPLDSLLLATGNTVEAVAGAWVLRRLGAEGAFTEGPRVGRFLGGMVAAAVPSALFAIAPLAGLGGPTPLAELVLTWYLGDLMGAVLVAPALVLLIRPAASVPRQAFEYVGFVAAVLAVAAAAFYPWQAEPWSQINTAFLAIGPLVWAAARFGPPATAWTTLALSLAAQAGLAIGEVPEASLQNARLLQVQALAAVMAGIGLYVAATVHQRNETIRLLEENQRRLAAADRMKTDFLNKAAHELRTPLMPIQLQARVLAEPRDPERQAHAVRILERNVDRLGRIITKLVAAARVGDEQARFEPHPVALRDVVDTAFGRIEGSAEARALDLVVDADPGEVRIDRDMVLKVLHELLENAVAHADSTVHLEARRTPQGSRWVVTDDGPGVPPHERERIFEPFAPSRRPGPWEGHGLGLYITKALVTGHGGTLQVEAADDGGARFVVDLPG